MILDAAVNTLERYFTSDATSEAEAASEAA
jgi:hypothetical protein